YLNRNLIPLEDRAVNSDNNKTETLIPWEKLLLFRNNPVKDNPEGRSPLISVHKLWQLKCAYEDNLAHGVASDVHGLKTLYLPPQYMHPEASVEDQAVNITAA